ncbi:MAG TPA: alpha/beta fold hydrolase [Polyangiaceae bacterium]|jgi:pimeloyl-ACP methyl ester carboxylesterase|nr:alpha/beta fold hydrolase [Polyangiaceae bacterium]
MKLNGLDFHVIDVGTGPAVLLLHGFPDSSRLWRHQIPALVAAGYRVIAPDMRGFGESSRPVGVEHYGLPMLVGDAVGILDTLGIERAHVVGHDWGSALAWGFAAMLPQKTASLTAISVGHPALFASLPIAQRERSWYMLFFQFEGVAETLLSRHDWKLFRELMRNQGDIEQVLVDVARPGALTAALAIYRANVPPAAQLLEQPPLPPVTVPTMGIWSDGDHFLIEEGVERSGTMVKDAPFRYEKISGAGHWIPVDAPEKLNALLLDFLPRHR